MRLCTLPADGDVHVWLAGLDRDAKGLEELLTADERQRAARFHLDVHRRRFVVGRGLLRVILCAYLNEAPEALPFSSGPRGKPALQSSYENHPVRFNATRSGDVALYAIALEREVGVDVEVLRDGLDILGIARRALPVETARAVERTDAAERQRAFFDAWVRHEARQKCLGLGLVDDAGGSPSDVSVAGLDLGPSCAGAVAVEGPFEGVLLRTWL